MTDAFVELFDERLVKMGKRLIADPSDMDAKVDFVTTYHMVIEGTLALTGQHFMLDYYEKNELLAGFAEGFAQHRPRRAPPRGLRHVVPPAEVRRGALPDRVQETLNELLPLAAGVLVPKGYSLGDDYEFFGYTAQEQAEFAYSALSRRLKVIGVGLPAPRPPSPTARRRAASVRRRPATSVCMQVERAVGVGVVACAGGRRGSPRARGRRRRSGARAGRGRLEQLGQSPSASRRSPAWRQSAARVSSPGGSASALGLRGRRRGAPRPARRHAASAARRPNTRHSASEFEASRFAPCRPVHAHSPTAYSPGSDERPSRSVATPPIV